MLRTKAVLAGSLFLLAVVSFAALAGSGAEGGATGVTPLELEQKSVKKLMTFENKLQHDKGQLDTVIHRLGEIKAAESKIKQEQATLLQKEAATRATVHDTRNKMVSLKYKIHNMKAVAFSDAMFGLSSQRSKKEKAHASLERKARVLERERTREVQEDVNQVPHEAKKVLAADIPRPPAAPVLQSAHSARAPAVQGDCFSAVPGWCAEHGAKEATVVKPAHAPALSSSTERAAIIARGLKRAKEQAEALRNRAKARAATNLALKKRKLEMEQRTTEKARELAVAHQQFAADEDKNSARTGAAERQVVAEPHVVHLPDFAHKDVSSMQAQVLRKRVAAFAPHQRPAVIGQPLHMPEAPGQFQQHNAVPHKPLTLEEAAEAASHNAAVAQKLAYMRSPQYWQSRQATHTTKRYGMMPGLPLLAPLDPAAADK